MTAPILQLGRMWGEVIEGDDGKNKNNNIEMNTMARLFFKPMLKFLLYGNLYFSYEDRPLSGHANNSQLHGFPCDFI